MKNKKEDVFDVVISKNSQAVLVSLILTIVFIAVLTISTELNIYLKTLLSNYFFNVWVGKGLLTASIFMLSVIYFRNSNIFREMENEVYFLRYLSLFSALSFLAIYIVCFFKFI